MNQAERIGQALLTHATYLERSYDQSDLERNFQRSSIYNGWNYMTHFSIGERTLFIEADYKDDICKRVQVYVHEPLGIKTVTIQLMDYDVTKDNNSEWFHKGSWCDLVDTYVTGIETRFLDRLAAIDRAFRLPSVLS